MTELMNKFFSHRNIIGLTAMICLLFAFVSCSNDDKHTEEEAGNPTIDNQDPINTSSLVMINHQEWYDIGIGKKIRVDENNHFVGEDGVEFAAVGYVNGLADISTIPTSGWATTLSVAKGIGYFIRSDEHYARLYVTNIDTDGKTNVKYQAPLIQKIEIANSMLNFTAFKETLAIKMYRPTSVSIKQKPEWCTITFSIDSIYIEVTDNNKTEARSGEIILTNALGDVAIYVVQGSIAPISFTENSYTFTDKDSTHTFTLATPTKMEVVKAPTWCTTTIETDALIVTVAPNFLLNERRGEILLTNNVSNATLTITQTGSTHPAAEAFLFLISTSGTGKTWTWDTSLNGGGWGNSGYKGDSGENFANTGSSTWWACPPKDLSSQMDHSVDKLTGDCSSLATMVFHENITVKCYDADGKEFRSGTFSIENWNRGERDADNWSKGILKTSAGATLWPFEINAKDRGATKYVTEYEIIELNHDKLVLVHPDGGAQGAWGEATWWRFKAK